jgi:hypothetical protein
MKSIGGKPGISSTVRMTGAERVSVRATATTVPSPSPRTAVIERLGASTAPRFTTA